MKLTATFKSFLQDTVNLNDSRIASLESSVDAINAHFSCSPPQELATLDRLTPGDFANVARRMQALGVAGPEEILRALTLEDAAKIGTTRPIGFGR